MLRRLTHRLAALVVLALIFLLLFLRSDIKASPSKTHYIPQHHHEILHNLGGKTIHENNFQLEDEISVEGILDKDLPDMDDAKVELWPKGKGPIVPGTGKKAVYINQRKKFGDQSEVKPKLAVGDCFGDCQALSELMSSWPKNKPRAAIYYLTKSDRLKQLKQSLLRLDSGFNKEYQYPIIIFHEAELVPSLEVIRQYTSSKVFFQQVAFAIPSFLAAEVREDIPCYSPMSYRHMCRFHSKLVYEYAIIHLMDYLWRLDDDSFILRPINYDIFRYMYDNQYLYGYIWIHRDNRNCTAGLWDATANYIKMKHLKPYFFDSWQDPQIYYNNFEVSAVKIWTSTNYLEYIDFLDRLGGIFYHRWGDAPIKSLAVSLFVPENRTHHFSDVGYQHTTFVN